MNKRFRVAFRRVHRSDYASATVAEFYSPTFYSQSYDDIEGCEVFARLFDDALEFEVARFESAEVGDGEDWSSPEVVWAAEAVAPG